MAGDYRDDLAAAHSRIAELEDKISALEADTAGPKASTGEFPELEADVERLRKAADEKSNLRKRNTIQMVATVFPLAGGGLSLLHSPIAATFCSVFFIAFIAAVFVLRAKLSSAKRALAESERALANARKVRELEQKLAAATAANARVRVDVHEAQGEAPRSETSEEETVAAAFHAMEAESVSPTR